MPEPPATLQWASAIRERNSPMNVWARSDSIPAPRVRGRERKAWIVIALAAVILLVPAGIRAPATLASTRGINGRLAFMRQDGSGFWQVWTSNPDLTAAHQLTSGYVNSGWPAWSPNASRIAFDSDRSDPDPSDSTPINDIFSMSAS